MRAQVTIEELEEAAVKGLASGAAATMIQEDN
jgi:hypothetical protein